MERIGDIFVLLGALIIVCALGWIWRPLGLLALGMTMIALGYVFAFKAQRAKRAAKDKS